MTAEELKTVEFDEDGLAEGLKCDIDVTKNFFEILMHNFESTNPKQESLMYIYFQTQTLCFVMFDRLLSMAEQADRLVNLIINK